MDEYDKLYKILIIGESGVGKSSIMMRYCDDTFESCHMSTIGVDFKIKTYVVDNKIYKIQIWDTAGQERFHTITTSYYRGASGILLVYDITDINTFNTLTNWIQDIRDLSGPDIPIVIIGNKSDLTIKRQISYTQGKEFADINNYQYIECSAKTNNNIDDVFMEIIQYMDRKQNQKGNFTHIYDIDKQKSCCTIL